MIPASRIETNYRCGVHNGVFGSCGLWLCALHCILVHRWYKIFSCKLEAVKQFQQKDEMRYDQQLLRCLEVQCVMYREATWPSAIFHIIMACHTKSEQIASYSLCVHNKAAYQ